MSSTYYRAVAMYGDAEISEGSGMTKRDAMADAQAQVSEMYPREDIRFELHEERL